MTPLFKEFCTIVVPIIISIVTINIQKYYTNYRLKKFQLTDHPIFSDIYTNIRDINEWRPSENRIVFIDGLKIELTIWREEGLKLAKELQKRNYSNLQLKNLISDWTNNCINSYTEEMRKSLIPNKVIDRITNINKDKINQFLSEVKNISYNKDMYPFKLQKIISIFDTLRLLLSETKNDFNQLIYREKYNGAFKGCYYQNIPVSDIEYQDYLIKKMENEIIFDKENNK